MWQLPVGDLFLVGRSTERTLHTLGIHTIGELAKSDLQVIKGALKKQGEVIWKFANGEGASIVESEPADSKSYGNATTIAFDVTDESTADMVLMSLAETVGRRLRRDEAKAQVVAVNIRYSDLSRTSHQCELVHATNITNEIYATACRLFGELWDGRPVRLLGIQTSHIKKRVTAYSCHSLTMKTWKSLRSLTRRWTASGKSMVPMLSGARLFWTNPTRERGGNQSILFNMKSSAVPQPFALHWICIPMVSFPSVTFIADILGSCQFPYPSAVKASEATSSPTDA